MYNWYTEKLENSKQKGKNLRLSGLYIGPRGR